MEQREQLVLSNLRGTVSRDRILEFVISNIYLLLINNNSIYLNDEFKKVAEEIIKPFDNEVVYRFNKSLELLDNESLYQLIVNSYKNNDVKFDDSSSDELIELVMKLFGDLYGGPIVFDACSGKGNFLIKAIEYSLKKRFFFKDLFGADINYQNVQISNMALTCIAYLLKLDIRPQTHVYNSMTDKFNFPITHAYVFPPLGLKFAMKEKFVKSKLYSDIEFSGRNTAEWIFVDNILSQNYGRTIAVISARALFSEDDKLYRNRLIEDGRLEGIIELPSGAVNFSGVKLALLIFSKNNKEVKILDASEFVLKKKKQFRNELDVERTYDSYMESNCDTCTITRLTESKNLLPSNLNIGEITFKNGVLLGEVAQVFTGSQYTLRNFEDYFSHTPTDYRILTSSDIENGIVDWKKLQFIQYNDTKFDKFSVQKDDVVVTSKSSKVKTVVVDVEPKEKILVTGGMIIIRPNTNRLNPTYLKMFLDSTIGQSVLKQIQKGAIIITINSKDLATIQVPLIDIEEQNKKAEKFSYKLTTILSLKREIEKLEKSLLDAFDECGGDE